MSPHMLCVLKITFFMLVVTLIIGLYTSCSSVTGAGPMAFMGNQSASRIEAEDYYENGNVKSKVVVEGYNTINPNPEVTNAVKDTAGLFIGAKAFVDVTEATVANPNKIPKDPNKIPKNPNSIPKDPNVIPKDPNVIPVDPNIKP